MNDNELRQAVHGFKKKYGTSIRFIATSCGVSREHISRWLGNSAYMISDVLKKKIKILIKGEM